MSDLTQTLCPTCGEPALSGFDGATDTPYEYCTRVRYRPPAEPLRCSFHEKPPRWLREALAQDALERELRETLRRGLETGNEDVVLFALHIDCGARALGLRGALEPLPPGGALPAEDQG